MQILNNLNKQTGELKRNEDTSTIILINYKVICMKVLMRKEDLI